MSCFIDGKWSAGESESFASINPSSGEKVWEGRAASPKQVSQAISAAKKAASDWRARSFEERLNFVLKFAETLQSQRETFSKLISEEMGKPEWESATEVGAMLGKVDSSRAAYQERCSEKIIPLGEAESKTAYRALGVMGVLGPYNFPGHLPNGHMIPGLLAGNTVVLKPSEQTPAVGELLVKLWEEAGLPPGVLNLVQGAGEVGRSLVASREISVLCFTGSSETGTRIHKELGGRPEVLLALEMGGNNPLVVWEPDNLKAAVFATIQSAFITSGQRCTCARRLIVGPGSDGFLESLAEVSSRLTLGDSDSQPQPYMGPVVNDRTGQQVFEKFQDLVTEGAKPLLEMKQGKRPSFLSPGILDVTNLGIEDKEVFGPLLQVIRVESFEEAVITANQTAYGLSAGLISPDRSKFDNFYRQSNAGIINWNRQTTGASGKAPFGGTGCSGNHRPSGYFASDYSSYPVASIEADEVSLPETLPPGFTL